MSQLNIALPDDEIGWAKSRVDAREFDSVDAYFSQLAKRDHAEAEEATWLQMAIDKGLSSEIDPRTPDQIFKDVRSKHLGMNGWAGIQPGGCSGR